MRDGWWDEAEDRQGRCVDGGGRRWVCDRSIGLGVHEGRAGGGRQVNDDGMDGKGDGIKSRLSSYFFLLYSNTPRYAPPRYANPADTPL